MTVAPGSRLGPYEIVSRIGAGGMGEVWRARDTRLDRSVAVKLLSADLANNAQLKVRFEREARSISQLNHPHICTLFDVGENYLVMELLDGETLADRIAKGPLPLADVIRYGIQIADALDRAHHAGIIHRDLKPANVMITKSGAKLLDFGLAKTSTSAVAGDAPTIQKALTQEGTILGTFQYMAPEQLEGGEADARTDIFAFGALLYEMTTGKRAFDGKTRTSLIAAIVGGQPAPIRTMQPLAPSALDHVIGTCLEKDPEKRWQSARDVANELQWIAAGNAVDETAAPANRWWPLAAALFAIIAVGAIAMFMRERARPPASPVSFSLLPLRGQTAIGPPTLSPDGRLAAGFMRDENGQAALMMRRISDGSWSRLANVDRAFNLTWSPDSKWLAFFGTNTLMRVSLDGGQPELVANIDGYGIDMAWSKSGDLVFTPKFGTSLYRVPASGGKPVPVTMLDAKRRETMHAHAHFLNDGDRFLYIVRTVPSAQNEIYAGSLRVNFQKAVTNADALVGVWKDWLLTVRNGAMYAQRFDEKNLTVSGEPHKIADDVRYSEGYASTNASVADDGAILYGNGSVSLVHVDVGWYDNAGHNLQRLFDASGLNGVALSPDESKVAICVYDLRKGASDLFVRENARGITTRITSGLSSNINPQWSPDGQRVYYSSDREGSYDIYAQTDDGVGAAQVIWKNAAEKHPMAISPDGKTMIATVYSPQTKDDLWIVPLDGGAPRPWIVTDGSEASAQFSPDGQWVVYTSDHSGRMETYVAAFPDGRSYQVSTAGGVGAEWGHDGSRVFFMQNSTRTLCSAEVKRNGKAAEIGAPVSLFSIPRTTTSWWRSKKADRFLLLTIVDPRETVQYMNYMKGWDAGLP